MKVAVLGASGSTGRLVVAQLVARGHEVVALSRAALAPAAGVQFRLGDPTDPAFLRTALADCDTVISCIGQSRASKSLFARRISPADLMERAVKATLAALGPRHLIYMSAFGVGRDRARHALLFRIILRLSSIHPAYLDHDRAEAAIRASGARWTIVRPPGLTEKDEERPLVDVQDRWTSFQTVSKRSVAAYLVATAERQAPLSATLTLGLSTPASPA